MNFPTELKYTREHEWVRKEGEIAAVGITEYAQEKLGSIVFVDLPSLGKSFQKGETLVTIDSVKTVAEVYAPLSGEVVDANQLLREHPELINQDAYGQGWMVRMKISGSPDLGSLLTAEAYSAFVAEEEAKG